MNIKHSGHVATLSSGSRRVSRRWRVLVGCVVVSAWALTLAACGDGGPDVGSGPAPTADAGELPTGVEPQPLAEKTKISVGQAVLTEAYLPLIMADRFGEFEKENLDVEISVAPDPASTIPLLDQGRIDVSATGPFGGFFNAVDTGSAVRFITSMGEAQNSPTSGGYYQRIPEGKTEPDPCDMKGKKVGLVGGWASSASLGFAKYLEKCDLGPDDVTIVTIDIASAPEALRNGAVEASYCLEPATVQVVKDGIATQVAVNPNGLGGFAAGKLRTENPEALQAFVRAMVRASQTYLQGDYRQDPEVLEVVVDYLGVDEATVNASKARVFDPNLVPDDLGNLMMELQSFWLENEDFIGETLQYDEPLPLDKLLDTTFVDNTMK